MTSATAGNLFRVCKPFQLGGVKISRLTSTAVAAEWQGGGVTVREAVPQDYAHVLGVGRDVYWGRDYLPWRYHALLASPAYRAIVCQQGDDIVGFAAAKVVDDGTSLILTSGRVSQRFQGQGLVKVMIDHLHLAFKDEHRLRRQVITTKGRDRTLEWRSFRREYRHVLERTIHSYHFDVREVRLPTATHYRQVTTDRSTVRRQTRLLQSALLGPTSRALFPQGRLVANWYPYMALPANAASIADNSYVTVSYDTALSQQDVPCTDSDCRRSVSNQNEKTAVLISEPCPPTNHSSSFTRSVSEPHPPSNHNHTFTPSISEPRPPANQSAGCTPTRAVSHVSIGCCFPCRLGLAYNLDLYGDLSCRTAVADHLLRHLQHAQHLTSARVHLLLFIDNAASADVVHEILDQLGVHRTRWEQTCLQLFECPLPPHRRENDAAATVV